MLWSVCLTRAAADPAFAAGAATSLTITPSKKLKNRRSSSFVDVKQPSFPVENQRYYQQVGRLALRACVTTELRPQTAADPPRRKTDYQLKRIHLFLHNTTARFLLDMLPSNGHGVRL